VFFFFFFSLLSFFLSGTSGEGQWRCSAVPAKEEGKSSVLGVFRKSLCWDVGTAGVVGMKWESENRILGCSFFQK